MNLDDLSMNNGVHDYRDCLVGTEETRALLDTTVARLALDVALKEKFPDHRVANFFFEKCMSGCISEVREVIGFVVREAYIDFAANYVLSELDKL